MKKLVQAQWENNPKKREEIIQDILRIFPLISREAAEEATESEFMFPVFVNDKYQVIKHDQGKIIWLSIKRRDKETIHDWRDLQEIKNQLVGPENEAFELYPAESRLVDTANQYHLWCFADPTYRIPVGFQERLVTSEQGRHDKQRPREETEKDCSNCGRIADKTSRDIDGKCRYADKLPCTSWIP